MVDEPSVVVTVVSGEPEAEMVCELLRNAGIACGYRDTEAVPQLDVPLVFDPEDLSTVLVSL